MKPRKRLTDLTEPATRPVMVHNNAGNIYWEHETYQAQRQIKTITPGVRLAHYLIDGFCFSILVQVIVFLLQLLADGTKSQVLLSDMFAFYESIIILALYPLLYILCEYKWQRTPGKFITKTIVIDEYADKPDISAIILRTVCRIVPFEPFSCLTSPYSRGWHDRWSKTYVVTTEEADSLRKELAALA